ncbi:MAG: Holliday junction branch migration protein RuvA [Gemmatimonadota bacterium]
MISRLIGTLVSRTEHGVEIATSGGVVYEIEIPFSVAMRLPPTGQEVELRTVYRVREDQVALFGFLTEGERALFLRLVAVTGVGAKLALAMLSTYPAPRLARALAEKDIAALVQVSGVGRKTAERLVLELSDRMAGIETDLAAGAGGGEGPQAAVQVLVALGMPFQEADGAVRAVLGEAAGGKAEEIVRKVLARR